MNHERYCNLAYHNCVSVYVGERQENLCERKEGRKVLKPFHEVYSGRKFSRHEFGNLTKGENVQMSFHQGD